MKKQVAKKKPVSLKPNSARLKKWVAALESGKFKKTECSLRGMNNTFCALGVGMRVYELETGIKLDQEKYWYDGNYDGVLPVQVRKWFGLKSRNPKVCVDVKGTKACKTITALNDDSFFVDATDQRIKLDFKTIAKGIRKTFGIK